MSNKRMENVQRHSTAYCFVLYWLAIRVLLVVIPGYRVS